MNNKLVNNDAIPQRDSFSELVAQLANNSATVVHDEIELLVQVTREKITAGCGGVIAVVIGASIIFIAFMCLCAAIIIGLTSYMTLITASLVTGGALFFIGSVIAFIGYGKLKNLMHNR